MPTIPTGKMELELRRLYVRWLSRLGDNTDMNAAVDRFEKQSIDLIEKMGGRTAMLGALADFPAPKRLDLSPHIGTIYSDMKQAAIQAGIQAGLNASDVARHMFRAGMDKSYNRLNRLARTETVSAYWKNAWDSIDGLPDLVMVWGSEDGPRTCAWCRERDGMVMESSQLRDHPNGRCTPIPTLRSMVEYKGSVDAGGRIYQDPAWTKKPTEAITTQETADTGWKPAMTTEEADLWAGDSVYQQTFYHGTSPEAAKAITREGFSLGEEQYGRLNGNGVYVTEDHATSLMYSSGGELVTRVKVKNPININDVFTDPAYFDAMDYVAEHFPELSRTQAGAAIITRFAEAQGYDSIIKMRHGIISELVVLDPKNVVVIKNA
mgnify:FL=1